ncbi:ATP-binding protein [Anabaena cylindrica UHCC 0172]|uniref:ATP-binding protein n=1 Tax=Anabaena cylindrica TaxID=1165 RepID=UPI002B20AC8F|nr:ATP-binding protein [Anabaena cylindrica]MEA5553732.1 ATP-binding protein [Anabaena cylindrica UHCC 0172]
MARNKPKLYRLTKAGHRLVKDALKSFESISSFVVEKNQHRQTFTKFHDGDGVTRDTAETYCDVLEIPNWRENWDDIVELVPEKITDWPVYDDGWVGRKQLVSSLTKKVCGNCRLLLLLGITGIGKTALSERIADDIQTRFTKILRVNFDSDDNPKDFVSVAGRWLEELGILIEDKQTGAILKRLVNHLREERILILIDSLEALLIESEDGWGDFEDEWWSKFFEHFLTIESSQSRLIVTSQDLPSKIETLASRYPNFYHREILEWLLEDEQIALFEKAGLDVDLESEDKPILLRIGKIYKGHPLTLRVISGEIVESFGSNTRAFWQNVGDEIELVEQHLTEAESGLKSEGVDDDWKLHKLTRKIRSEVYRRRVDTVFKRLKNQNPDAYLLICLSAIYRRPVQDSGWLLQLDKYVRHFRNEVYSKEKQQQVLDNLFARFLVETSINHENHRVLGLDNLIRSVALEHRQTLFT